MLFIQNVHYSTWAVIMTVLVGVLLLDGICLVILTSCLEG